MWSIQTRSRGRFIVLGDEFVIYHSFQIALRFDDRLTVSRTFCVGEILLERGPDQLGSRIPGHPAHGPVHVGDNCPRECPCSLKWRERCMRRRRHLYPRTASRGGRPSDSWPLGRRSAGRRKEQLHCNAGGAAFTLSRSFCMAGRALRFFLLKRC